MTFHPADRTRDRREPLIVRPREGYLVRDPSNGHPLPPKGKDVSHQRLYFERRLASGDVERITRAKRD